MMSHLIAYCCYRDTSHIYARTITMTRHRESNGNSLALDRKSSEIATSRENDPVVLLRVNYFFLLRVRSKRRETFLLTHVF